jgi:hypothetical protein
MRFFLIDLGDHKVILGYPWFVATQPQINWKRGWIDYSQLPLIARAPDAAKAMFVPRNQNKPQALQPPDWYYIGRVTIGAVDTPTTSIPTEYQRHMKIFSELASHHLPRHTIWDHVIELLPGAPNMLPG